MTYEAKQMKAQEKATRSGRTTCIFETYEGYKIGFLTWQTVASAQETFEPVSIPASSIFAVNKYGEMVNLHGPKCFECHQHMNVSRVSSVRGVDNVQVCLHCKPFESVAA